MHVCFVGVPAGKKNYSLPARVSEERYYYCRNYRKLTLTRHEGYCCPVRPSIHYLQNQLEFVGVENLFHTATV